MCSDSRTLSPKAPVSQVGQSQVETDDAAPAAKPSLMKKAISGEQAHKVVQEQYRIFDREYLAQQSTAIRQESTGETR